MGVKQRKKYKKILKNRKEKKRQLFKKLRFSKQIVTSHTMNLPGLVWDERCYSYNCYFTYDDYLRCNVNVYYRLK